MKIVIATGGTGGHIIPALQTSFVLKEKGHDLLLVGSFGSWTDRVKMLGFPVKELHAVGLRFRSFARVYESVVAMIKALRHSLMILKKFEPEVVIGFGGYGAFPAVVGAQLLHLPTVIHEQNVVPGRANRLLARSADRIAVTFADSRKYFKAEKVVLTGCPCNFSPRTGDERIAAIKRFGLEEHRRTVLILGGSQGSHRINLAAVELMKELSRDNVQVIHISGAADYDQMNAAYRSLGVPFKVFDFCEEMPLVLRLGDVAVARAGALTLMETALAGIPTVFIPYPFAGGHQKENALALVRIGAARMIEEAELNTAKLADAVRGLMNEASRASIIDKLKDVAIADAAQRLSREIVGLKK